MFIAFHHIHRIFFLIIQVLIILCYYIGQKLVYLLLFVDCIRRWIFLIISCLILLYVTLLDQMTSFKMTNEMSLNITTLGVLMTEYPYKYNSLILSSVRAMSHCPDDSIPRRANPYSKVHGAYMGPIWGRQGPDGPRVDPINLAIWVR